MSELHIDSIRHEVFRRTGMNIAPDDPFFVAMTMIAVAAERIEKNNARATDQLAKIAADLKNDFERNQRRQAEDLSRAASEVVDATNRLNAARLGVPTDDLVGRLFGPVIADISAAAEKLLRKDTFAQELARNVQKIELRWASAAASAAWTIVLSFAAALIACGYFAYRVGVASCAA